MPPPLRQCSISPCQIITHEADLMVEAPKAFGRLTAQGAPASASEKSPPWSIGTLRDRARAGMFLRSTWRPPEIGRQPISMRLKPDPYGPISAGAARSLHPADGSRAPQYLSDQCTVWISRSGKYSRDVRLRRRAPDQRRPSDRFNRTLDGTDRPWSHLNRNIAPEDCRDAKAAKPRSMDPLKMSQWLVEKNWTTCILSHGVSLRRGKCRDLDQARQR